MIFDISMGLNGIPLCINVKYKGKSFNSIKRELHSILNGIPLIKSNESKWSMRIQLDWMESHYVAMYSQLILKGNHSIQLKRELHSILNGMPLFNSNEPNDLWCFKGLNGIPLCINVYSIISKGTFVNSPIYWIESPSSHQIKGKVIQFNWRGNSIRCLLKPLYQCILNGIQLINSKESQWSLIFQWDWMESHYVSM
jgi:hypothetical protein